MLAGARRALEFAFRGRLSEIRMRALLTAQKARPGPDPVFPNPTTRIELPLNPKDASYRSFRVLMDNRLKMTAIIQKRTMIFGSVQPFNSK